MPLTPEQQERLEDIIALTDENRKKLNDWERSFIDNQKERMEKPDYFVTPKMWSILEKIEAKCEDS